MTMQRAAPLPLDRNRLTAVAIIVLAAALVGAALPATGRDQSPASAQDVIMARIDRLDEASKQLLKIASVIGRSFFYRVLRSIVGVARDLDQDLDLRIVREFERVTGDFELREINVAGLTAVAHCDGADVELRVAAEQRDDARPHCSQTKNAKSSFCSHNQRSLTGEKDLRNPSVRICALGMNMK